MKVKQQIQEIFDAEFFGHPSRKDEFQIKEAILLLAEHIDKLELIQNCRTDTPLNG